MTWIPDVVTRTTIASTWGNTIRNHVVHDFATTADATAKVAAVADGSLAWIADQGRTFVRRGAAWYPLTSQTWDAPLVTLPPLIGAGVVSNVAQGQLPAGYRTALVSAMVAVVGQIAGQWLVELRAYGDGGNRLLGAARRSGTAEQTADLTATATTAIAGEGVILTIQNLSSSIEVIVNPNNYYTRFSFLQLP